MDYLIMAFNHFDTGGLQTLMVRMARWSLNNNIKPIIFFETADDYMLELCNKNKIEFYQTYRKKEIVKILKEKIYIKANITIITFELPQFMMFENIINKYLRNYNVNHIIYNVSVNGMISGRKIKGLFGKIIYKFYLSLVNRIFNNKQVYFMDDDTFDAVIDYYKIKDIDRNDCILLLPMFIENKAERKFNFEKKNILTVSRADFPYKGYIMGLLDDFEALREKYDDITLEIVSFGKDIEKIEEKIKESKFYDDIKLIKGLTEEEIKQRLHNTYLYIGMGTTVLDAANEKVPSIVTCHSTMQNLCVGFFSENPRIIGKYKYGNLAIEYMEKIICLSKEEYKAMCSKVFEEYQLNYDISIIMPSIIKKKIENKVTTYFDYYISNFFYKIRAIRRRIFKIDSKG